ncbi:hypothetical protein [Streptomyces huiliensis]|uniref:hypothetical protein n=1 Tax=Streptomyces huiliensis TaxID=2876027 RepID=UPI001CBE29B0|nr:hypothetical protein [Streptomyces huiliensis]MBZ4321047.1 hypothetical protein [Streptomyces huiliensis]
MTQPPQRRPRARRLRRRLTAFAMVAAAAVPVGVVGPAAPAASAAPMDRVTASWNMQGQSASGETRRHAGIQQILRDGVQVLALQEAGNAPPETAEWTHRVFGTSGVTEHQWEMGTPPTT